MPIEDITTDINIEEFNYNFDICDENILKLTEKNVNNKSKFIIPDLKNIKSFSTSNTSTHNVDFDNRSQSKLKERLNAFDLIKETNPKSKEVFIDVTNPKSKEVFFDVTPVDKTLVTLKEKKLATTKSAVHTIFTTLYLDTQILISTPTSGIFRICKKDIHDHMFDFKENLCTLDQKLENEQHVHPVHIYNFQETPEILFLESSKNIIIVIYKMGSKSILRIIYSNVTNSSTSKFKECNICQNHGFKVVGVTCCMYKDQIPYVMVWSPSILQFIFLDPNHHYSVTSTLIKVDNLNIYRYVNFCKHCYKMYPCLDIFIENHNIDNKLISKFEIEVEKILNLDYIEEENVYILNLQDFQVKGEFEYSEFDTTLLFSKMKQNPKNSVFNIDYIGLLKEAVRKDKLKISVVFEHKNQNLLNLLHDQASNCVSFLNFANSNIHISQFCVRKLSKFHIKSLNLFDSDHYVIGVLCTLKHEQKQQIIVFSTLSSSYISYYTENLCSFVSLDYIKKKLYLIIGKCQLIPFTHTEINMKKFSPQKQTIWNSKLI